MIFEKVNKEIIYCFSSDLEAIFLTFHLLNDEENFRKKIDFSNEKIDEWKVKYRYLFEIYDSIKGLNPLEILDFMLDVVSKEFSIEEFKKYVLSIKKEDRLKRIVAWPYEIEVTKEELKKAIKSDKAMNELFNKIGNRTNSFLGLSSFIRENDRYVEEFFELANELNSSELVAIIKKEEKKINVFHDELIKKSKNEKPMEISQNLMGKTFKNRGPYEEFYFIPSLFVPMGAFRLFYDNGTSNNRQILVKNVDNIKSSDNTIGTLKSIADDTRYKILKVIASKGPVKGQDIVNELKLAASTVSHHMSELKQSGLITEEPFKNAKYYGLSKKNFKNLIDNLKEDFEIE